ncbi:UNVERIFIED_ORG: hypothetical protein M2438_002647 [Methylobacterium sp. SuP10 SLI 274]|uniref:DUF475 domain-containing protein n=1 Tax=Methylorubrum extorquens TaxID=408 RepID=UPI00209E9927|nr:DUF475 domain-containing protein [Methylorubrum extorquens]MDF9863876.1 hypothetical protein [Methylorubrum pseudosasae]MDH6637472.1 hypothetical protein [Methylobacterium sp. SuP10 SLI 274]MDH6666652.1 hypothetical protein [Methylorubrum zatmanii]MCP1558562.1 hypothetical protein [Methylorubrum extorquens]MDF9792189.1 hypothetical protein [Methylorubrum extorquens]
MAANLKYFRYAIGLSALMFVALAFAEGGVALLPLAMVLAIMELAVSFDNAIVNAKVMERMSPFWRQAFITVGIFIAVFGMRFYLPIQIVSWLGGLSLSEASRLAYADPGRFAQILISSHAIVSGFGGAFLMMIFLKFFIDSEREGNWLPGVESVLGHLGHLEGIQILITGVAAGFTAYLMPEGKGVAFFVAAMAGIGTHITVDLIKEGLEAIDLRMQERSSATGGQALATGGLGMFLYLEIFDASMSFDGVIAAFAITNNILVVAVGLGVGAVFVRSLTLLFFDTKSLAEYRYLEPGAFWAIGGLSAFMFIAAVTHVPEWLISAYGGAVIVIAFIHSVVANRGDSARNAGLGLSEAVERKIGSPEASRASA